MKKKVSVIVRTCGRPEVLKIALDSIRKQTYPNIEVVIQEDGLNISENMIRREYEDLNISYEATGEKSGRTKVGNRALSRATGEYLNFLDDDDYFFPDHLEKLVSVLENSSKRAAYSLAEEVTLEVCSKSPYITKEHGRTVRYQQPYNKLLLYYTNYFPIQTVLFERSLFLEFGGFDENLDVLEDWDLWARYSVATDFEYLSEVTSVYHVPYGDSNKNKRDKELFDAQEQIRKKFEGYSVELTAEQINREVYDLLNSYKTEKNFLYYLRKFYFKHIKK